MRIKVCKYILIFMVIFQGVLAAPSIFPLNVKMDMAEGHNYSTVTVFNTGDKAMKYRLKINDLDNQGNKSGLAPYLSVFPRFMKLDPGKSQVVSIMMRGVPTDQLKNGEYRGSLEIEELESSVQRTYKRKEKATDIETNITFKYILNMAIYGYLGELVPKIDVKKIKKVNGNITGEIQNIGNYSYMIKYEILNKADKIVDSGMVFKLLYNQKSSFSIKNNNNGAKIIFLEEDSGNILYKNKL